LILRFGGRRHYHVSELLDVPARSHGDREMMFRHLYHCEPCYSIFVELMRA